MSARGGGYYIDLPASALDADRPVSTLRSYLMRADAQHLIDSEVQYRVNWVADLVDGGEIRFEGGSADYGYAAWLFPVTMLETKHPPHFDVLISAHMTDALGGGESAFVSAALGPWTARRELEGGQNPEQWFYTRQSLTSTSITELIDERWEWPDQSDTRYFDARRTLSVLESAVQRPAEIILARLEVVVGGSFISDYDASVDSVMLREYP